jgi:hypothetical protein
MGKYKIVTDFEGHIFSSGKKMTCYWLKIDYDSTSKCIEGTMYNYYNRKIKEYNSIDIALCLSLPENINNFNYKKSGIETINYINKYIGDKLFIKKFITVDNKVYAICKNIDNTESILHISIINKIFREARIQKVHEYWDTHEFNGFAMLCPCGCGNYFPSEVEMCEYHNRNYNGYLHMKHKGATMLKALLGPQKILCPCGCGNYFTSEAKMCEYHNRDYSSYGHMKYDGATMKEALLGPKPKKILCPCGCNSYFSSEKEMCEYYNRSISAYANMKMYNKNNIEICLGIIPSLKVSNHRNLHTYLTDTLYLEKVFEKDNKIYCECKDNGEDVVLSKEVVENICREYNLNKIREKHKLIPISEE